MILIVTEHFIQIVSELNESKYKRLINIISKYKLNIPHQNDRIVIYSKSKILYLILVELSKYYDLHII